MCGCRCAGATINLRYWVFILNILPVPCYHGTWYCTEDTFLRWSIRDRIALSVRAGGAVSLSRIAWFALLWFQSGPVSRYASLLYPLLALSI